MPRSPAPALTVRVLPASVPQSGDEERRPSAPRRPLQRQPAENQTRKAAAEVLEKTATPSGEEGSAPPVPAPPERIGGLVLDAKRAAGNIDRELRREFPSRGLSAAAPESVQSRLEKGIAGAARPQPGMTESVLPDGRRVTKLSGPWGSYCVTRDNAGAPNGIDQMQHGVQHRVTNCGNLFD